MKKVEVKYNEPVFCPLCDTKILTDAGTNHCPHILLIVTDESLEYCSEKLDIKVIEEIAFEDGWDEATDKIQYPNTIKYARYQPAPSNFGAYFVFGE